jgi:hypothetical protein
MRVRSSNIARGFLITLACLALGTQPGKAGAHTWDVNEIFSNPDGTIQFIEIKETGGGDFETGVNGSFIVSNANSYDIPNPSLVGPTGFKHLLFATAAFASLPGAPTPNYTIPDNFLSTGGDTIQYSPYDSITFAPGQLPTNGIQSLNRSGGVLVVGVNSPTNYAGESGSIDVSQPAPPPVPDGTAGAPLLVDRLDTAGTSLRLSWDVISCSPVQNHHILYGQRSNLPPTPAGNFTLAGAQCAIGATSPYDWNSVPDPDAGRLLWWLLVVENGDGREGSWGQTSAATERTGPGVAGSSGFCNVTTKDLTNTCQ